MEYFGQSNESRKEQWHKGEIRDSHKRGVKRYTSKRLQQPDDEDPDIQAEINKGNTVTIMLDY